MTASAAPARSACRCRASSCASPTRKRGKAVAQGEIGVIEVRGRNVFAGYWNMPEKTKEEFRADGFFITGDLGEIDADGYVTIVGRAKDLVISGGYNIYPKEVEMLLDEQPGVLESAVVGAPHPDLGEGVVAVVTPRPGAVLDEAALLAGIADRLARFKQPRRIVIADELPRNTMGKVQKNLLRDRYRDIFKTDHDPEKWKPVFGKDHGQTGDLPPADRPSPDDAARTHRPRTSRSA